MNGVIYFGIVRGSVGLFRLQERGEQCGWALDETHQVMQQEIKYTLDEEERRRRCRCEETVVEWKAPAVLSFTIAHPLRPGDLMAATNAGMGQVTMGVETCGVVGGNKSNVYGSSCLCRLLSSYLGRHSGISFSGLSFMERIHARQATCRGSKALLFVKACHVCEGVWYFGTGA